MAIMKWDPFDVHSFMRWPMALEDEQLDPSNRQLDVYETEENIVVKAGIAGVKPENIDITFDDGVLTIRGEEEEEEENDDKKFYKKSQRSYSYRVAVPGNIDLDQDPEAEVNEGVLTVKFVKSEEAKPRKIEVKV